MSQAAKTTKRGSEREIVTVSRRELRDIVRDEFKSLEAEFDKILERGLVRKALEAKAKARLAPKPRAIFGALKGRGSAGSAILEPMSSDELKEWGAE